MAAPPAPLSLRAEALGDDLPAWALTMFEQLNAYASQVNTALAEVPELKKVSNKTFTTDASGNATVDLQNPFGRKPDDVLIGKVNQHDNAEITDVYSATWAVASDRIRVVFAGLAASTKHRFNAIIL